MGVLDEPRPGSPRTITDEQVEEAIVKTLETTPRDATHWSTRSMAREVGLTQSAVLRIWRAFGLQPHRQETLEAVQATRSSSTRSATSSGSICTRPSARSCCASMRSPRSKRLDRTAPILPMLPAPPSAPPTTTSAPEPRASTPRWRSRTGKVIGVAARSPPRDRVQEVPARRIDREVPAQLDVHLVLDNSSTHKTPAIQRWLAAHPASSCTSRRRAPRG